MSDAQSLAQHVLRGLSRSQKALSSEWFYDDKGSRLFQRIMALPEYYLTRAEHDLLRDRADALLAWINPDQRPLDLIELGSGDGEKALTLCRALHARNVNITFRPIDVSAHALAELSRRFDEYLPSMVLEPVLGDYSVHWPAVDPDRHQVVMLLGSNLGNFDEASASALLRRIRAQLRAGDVLLLGLDLIKNPKIIQAAYDDAQGVTAAFNLNLLRRLNRELGMNFDLSRFSHFASYCPIQGIMRSFLVSDIAQTVSSVALDREFIFAAGETLHTEQSQKYTPESISNLAARCGFVDMHLEVCEQHRYALAIWRGRDDSGCADLEGAINT